MSKSKNINPTHHLCWDQQCFRNRPLTCLGMNGNWVWESVDLAWGKQMLPGDAQSGGWLSAVPLEFALCPPYIFCICAAGPCRSWAQRHSKEHNLQNSLLGLSAHTPCTYSTLCELAQTPEFKVHPSLFGWLSTWACISQCALHNRSFMRCFIVKRIPWPKK